MKEITIVGISGSPRKKGNTALMVRRALESAGRVEGVRTEFFDLSGMKIQNCIGCEACRKQESLCVALKDDMATLYPALMKSQAIILGSPVYFGDVTGLTKALMDRTTCLGGTPAAGLQYALKWKIGAGITVGGARYGGQEFALKTIHNFFLIHGMLLVSGIPSSGYWGAAGRAAQRDEILQDGPPGPPVMEICDHLGWRVAMAAKYMAAAKEVLGEAPLHFTKK